MTLFTQVERNLPYLTERYVGLAPNGIWLIHNVWRGGVSKEPGVPESLSLWLPRLNII
jgi:hypothetical protein